MIWQRSVVAKEEVPEFYLWSETEGTKSRVYVSTQKSSSLCYKDSIISLP